MKVVGSVGRDEVPQANRKFGLWTGLADQAIAEYRKGRVLTVSVADREELKKLQNGVGDRLRKAGFARQFAVVEKDGEILLYMQLVEGSLNGPSVAPPPPPRRRRQA